MSEYLNKRPDSPKGKVWATFQSKGEKAARKLAEHLEIPNRRVNRWLKDDGAGFQKINDQIKVRKAKDAAPKKGNPRRDAVLKTAKDAGFFAGETSRIAGRIRKPLIEAARASSGIKSDTALIEYALACVALEDDFGEKLLARRGRVPKDLDLEF